jgi:predicted PurR-regulated permease PerM
MLQLILPPLIDERFGQAQAVLGITQNSLAAFAVNVLDSTLPLLQGLGNILLTFLANLLLVVFVSILLLIEPQTYRRIGLMLVPRPHHARFRQIWNEIHRTLTRWIVAQSISVAITIALVWFILGVLLSMPNALIVALFAGFATFIPNIGAFLPLIPIVVFTIADDPARLLVVAPVYLAIQFVESNILTPSIVDAELHIPIGGLLFFQVIAASLFGALGLLLAAPLLAVLATIVRETYSYDVLGLRNVDLDAALTAAASDSGEDEEHPVLLSEPAAQGS